MLVECVNCSARVDAQEVAELLAPIHEPEVKEAYGASHAAHFDGEVPCPPPQWLYTLLKCRSCGDALLVCRYDFDATYVQRLWPPVRHRLPGLPRNIDQALDEAVQCLNAHAFLATVLMCRRALEGTCRHFYPDIRPLAFGLKKLQDDRIIDARLAEWAHALRDSGNLAAHDPDAGVTEDDARDLLDFTEAILSYVFVLHEKFQVFRRRRAAPADE
jgi:hypothetical protein